MGKLPGTSKFIEELDYALEKVQDPKEEEGPSIILLKPTDTGLTERIEQTLVFLADPAGNLSPIDFSPDSKKRQYLDYIANYKDTIGIILNRTGNSAEDVKNNIITKLNEVLGMKLSFEIQGFSYCRPGVETSGAMITEAYRK